MSYILLLRNLSEDVHRNMDGSFKVMLADLVFNLSQAINSSPSLSLSLKSILLLLSSQQVGIIREFLPDKEVYFLEQSLAVFFSIIESDDLQSKLFGEMAFRNHTGPMGGSFLAADLALTSRIQPIRICLLSLNAIIESTDSKEILDSCLQIVRLFDSNLRVKDPILVDLLAVNTRKLSLKGVEIGRTTEILSKPAFTTNSNKNLTPFKSKSKDLTSEPRADFSSNAVTFSANNGSSSAFSEFSGQHQSVNWVYSSFSPTEPFSIVNLPPPSTNPFDALLSPTQQGQSYNQSEKSDDPFEAIIGQSLTLRNSESLSPLGVVPQSSFTSVLYSSPSPLTTKSSQILLKSRGDVNNILFDNFFSSWSWPGIDDSSSIPLHFDDNLAIIDDIIRVHVAQKSFASPPQHHKAYQDDLTSWQLLSGSSDLLTIYGSLQVHYEEYCLELKVKVYNGAGFKISSFQIRCGTNADSDSVLLYPDVSYASDTIEDLLPNSYRIKKFLFELRHFGKLIIDISVCYTDLVVSESNDPFSLPHQHVQPRRVSSARGSSSGPLLTKGKKFNSEVRCRSIRGSIIQQLLPLCYGRFSRLDHWKYGTGARCRVPPEVFYRLVADLRYCGRHPLAASVTLQLLSPSNLLEKVEQMIEAPQLDLFGSPAINSISRVALERSARLRIFAWAFQTLWGDVCVVILSLVPKKQLRSSTLLIKSSTEAVLRVIEGDKQNLVQKLSRNALICL